MFFELNQFPFLLPLIENVTSIADEFDNAIKCNIVTKSGRHLNLFQYLQFFDDAPLMHSAVEDWTKSGGFHSRIKTHWHLPKNLIFHLTLFDTDGISTITCNEATRNCARRGDCLIFDYTYPHSASNQSLKDRINLMVDFTARNISSKPQKSC